MFELQDTSVDYTQLTPLRVLEQAGILNLPPPHKIGPNFLPKMSGDCHGPAESRNFLPKMSGDCHGPGESRSVDVNSSTLPGPVLHQDVALLQGRVNNRTCNTSSLLKPSSHGGQESGLPLTPNSQHNLHSQSMHATNLESIVPQSFVMNENLKEELNVIIEAPIATQELHSQEQFSIIHDASVERLRGVRGWDDGNVEAIMSGKHIVLVKKVLNPDNEEPSNSSGGVGGRAVCKICFNEFANKNVLMRHQVVHSGLKPHCCFTCFKEFNDVSSLRKHILIHKRSHKCPICLKMFLRRRQMELHLRQHNKKRFIQFGHKYHEVQVVTRRNELQQIVHEFSLAALLKWKDKENDNGSQHFHNNNSLQESSLVSESFTSFDNDKRDDKLENWKSIVKQGQEMTENGRFPDSPQMSYKKVMYMCGHCKKVMYTRPTLSRHLMLHTNEKPFNCQKCGKTFRHKSDLVHHYKTHLKPVKCHTCGSAFSKRLYLNKHLEKGCPFLEEDNMKFTVLPDLTYQCNLCSKVLKTRSNVYRHLRVHAFEDRKFQESDTKKVAKTVKDIQGLVEGVDLSDTSCQDVNEFIHPLTNSVGFQCTICQEEFRFKSFILIHVRMHLNQRPFKCKECGCGFYGRYQLRKHQQNHTRPYKCPKCGKGFNRRYLMTHHFNRNHSDGYEDKMKDITVLFDKKLLSCNICGKTMKSYQKSLMQYHIRLHKDVRPFQCKECLKSFISDIALKKHSLNHSKPYVCQVCGKGFSRRYLMLEHFGKKCGSKGNKMKSPSRKTSSSLGTSMDGFVSNLVAKDGFDSDNPYEAETVTEFDEQNGLQTFKCVPCDKSFSVKDALIRHIKTFMKQTACKYCKSLFADKHLTLAHQRCCLGVGVEIKPTSPVRRNSQNVSQRQEKVFKVMEEIHQKIEDYTTSGPETAKSDSHNTNTVICNHNTANSEEESFSNSTIDEGVVQLQNNSEGSGSNSDIIRNKRLHTISILKSQNAFPCPECDKTFMTTRGLKIHASCHVRLYKCEICGDDFTHIKAFRNHVKTHDNSNNKDVEIVDNKSEKGESAPMTASAKGEKMDKCGSHVTNKDKMADISEKSPVKKLKQTSTPVSTSAIGKNVAVNRQRENVDVTVRLMQSGTRGRPYSCRLCRRRFTEEAGLIAHMSQIHGVEST